MQQLVKKIRSTYGDDIDELMSVYAETYFTDENGNITVDADYILEEILCDAAADIDILAGRKAETQRAPLYGETVREELNRMDEAVTRAENDDGGEKYSIAEPYDTAGDNKGLNRNTIQALQGITQKSNNSLTSAELQNAAPVAKRYWQQLGVKSPFFRAWFGDWRANDTTPIEIADKAGSTRDRTIIMILAGKSEYRDRFSMKQWRIMQKKPPPRGLIYRTERWHCSIPAESLLNFAGRADLSARRTQLEKGYRQNVL